MGSHGCSMKYSYHSSHCTDDCDNGGESTDRSYVVNGKVHVSMLSWFNVTGVNCCDLVDSSHF